MVKTVGDLFSRANPCNETEGKRTKTRPKGNKDKHMEKMEDENKRKEKEEEHKTNQERWL